MQNRPHMKRTRQPTETELAARELGELLADWVPRDCRTRVRKAVERLASAVYAQGFQAGAVDRQAVASLLGAIFERR